MIEIYYECTCGACPTQYQGTIDGNSFYFRYRYGHWVLEIETDAGEQKYSGSYDDSMGGVMSEDRVLGIIQGICSTLFPGEEVGFREIERTSYTW